MRYTLVMTRVKIEYMLFAAMSLVAGAAYGRGPVSYTHLTLPTKA